jgi:hypothetical protein
MIFLASAMMFVTAISASGQDTAGGSSKPVIQDWSTHHVVFSPPGSESDAIRAGNYERWLKIVNDPRYIMQQRRRSIHVSGADATKSRVTEPALLRGESDADIEAAGAAAAATEMTLEEREVLQRGNRNLPSGLMRALIPPSGAQMLGFAPTISPAIGNIGKNRMKKDWSEDMGSNATVGLGDFPATYTTGVNCTTDFAVFNTGLTGSSSQASIIGYKNLYTTCNGSMPPTTYWAYNTAGGTIINGIDLSQDGTQIGFVQTEGGVATLVLLKWASGAGTIFAPTTLTAVATSSYPSCAAPCMTAITLTGSPTDTYSFPYYDAGSDTIYVGDDAGKLHKFNPVFRGTSGTPPVEIGSPWPVQLPAAANESALGSPVYDSTTAQLFVGDYLLNTTQSCEPSANTTIGSCGYLYSVSSSGTVTVSHELDYNIGILDSPIVDSSAGTVYAFVGDDGSSNCKVNAVSGFPCAGVFQFPVGFLGGATGTEATVGPGYEFMMSGSFDNAYYTSGDPPTGHLYVVGNTGPANNTLYQIPINSGTMGTSVAGPAVATNYTDDYYAAGLQVTEFYNTSAGDHDYIFLSVLAFGADTGGILCPNQSVSIGCVMGFDVTSGTISSSTAATGVLQESGGTSGIVVDNGVSGASNIYFSTLLNQSCTGGTGGCAIQTSQSAP